MVEESKEAIVLPTSKTATAVDFNQKITTEDDASKIAAAAEDEAATLPNTKQKVVPKISETDNVKEAIELLD